MNLQYVLSYFSEALYQQFTWTPHLPAGFSGAHIWQGSAGGVSQFALKRWPAGTNLAQLKFQLFSMHNARVVGDLHFVPRSLNTSDGSPFYFDGQHAWSVELWMPGEASYHREPNREKQKNAITALAQLHKFWRSEYVTKLRCPGLLDRLLKLKMPLPRLNELKQAGPMLYPLFEELEPMVRRLTPLMIAELELYVQTEFDYHTCLCDVWQDHLLFTGNQLTGLIDFGEVKHSNPHVDLARMLGDLEPTGSYWPFAISAYKAVQDRPVNLDYVWLLHRSGVICAVRHWMQHAAKGTLPKGAETRIADRLDRYLLNIPKIFSG